MAISQKAIKENEKILIGYNIGQIFNKGENIEGKKLKRKGKPYPIYSPQYEKKKKKVGKYQGFVDLHVSGKYYKVWIIDLKKNQFSIQASEVPLNGGYDLTQIFRDAYGKFEGLQENNFKEFKEKYFLPALLKYKNEIFR